MLLPVEAALSSHPATPADAVRAVGAGIESRADRLIFRYQIEGDLTRIVVPGAEAQERRDHLWEHTCCEAFIATAAATYFEFNFSPGGDWACYRFRSYRQRAAPDPVTAPPWITATSGHSQLELEASVAVDGLAELRAGRHLRVALAVVIEELGGRRSYWALHHPSAQPDFHHPDSFVLLIESNAPPT